MTTTTPEALRRGWTLSISSNFSLSSAGRARITCEFDTYLFRPNLTAARFLTFSSPSLELTLPLEISSMTLARAEWSLSFASSVSGASSSGLAYASE